MRYGQFDDDQREYVITRPGHARCPGSTTWAARTTSGSSRTRPAATRSIRDARLRRLTRYRYNNAPLDLGGRYLYLRDDAERPVLEPQLAADAQRARGLRVPPRPGLHDDRLAAGGDPGRDTYFVPLGETLEVWRARSPTSDPSPPAVAVRRGRVLPVGRAGRRHQLPAQLLDRRGRGRGRRHLPQDRVPRAARPLRLLRLLGAVGRLRHVARRLPRAVPRLGPPDRRRARGDVRARSRTAGSRSAPTRSAWSWPPARRARSSSCSATRRTRRTPSSTRPARRPSTSAASGRSSTGSSRRTRWTRPSALRRSLGRAARDPPGGDRQRARRPDGQHLERLPVHGHVQPVALGVAVRVGHRARHGLPRLEPGPARLRPHGPRARPPADPRHRGHAAADRRRLPPVPAADQARQRRRRVRLQRRPAWLVLGGGRLPQGDRRLAILDEPVPYDNQAGTEPPLYEHLQRAIGYTLERLGPHGLPLIGRADWNDCLNLNCFSETPGESFQTTENRRAASPSRSSSPACSCWRRTRWRAIAERRGDEDEARALPGGAGRWMTAAVEQHGWDGAWFRRAYDYFGEPIGSADQRRGPDLHRAAGHLHPGRHRPGGRPGGPGPGLGPRAAGDRARDRPPAARLLALLPGAWRDLVVPARLQGERRHLLPHQPLGHDRRGRGRQRRRAPSTTTCASTLGPRGTSPRSIAASRTSTPR